MPLRALPHHAVLPGADDRSYHSVQIRPISRAQRFALGRQLRHRVPRASLGQWQPRQTSAGSHRANRPLTRRSAGVADSNPCGAHGRVTLRLSAWRNGRHDPRPLAAPGDGHHAGHLRRRTPGQFRPLCLSRTRPRDRLERLRRGAPRSMGVGPPAAGRQSLDRGPPERHDGSAVRRRGDGMRGLVPRVRPVPCEPAIAVALLSAGERRPAAHDGEGEIAP